MRNSLFSFLIPPLDDDPEGVRRHRIAISLGLAALLCAMAAAYGLAPGFSGFAYASTVTDIKIELLEQRLFDTRLRQCSATTPEGRQFYGQKVPELMVRYQATAGIIYPLPSCEEIR